MQKVLHPVDQEISFKCLWQILLFLFKLTSYKIQDFFNDSNQRPKNELQDYIILRKTLSR